jgi:hypothetical protein
MSLSSFICIHCEIKYLFIKAVMVSRIKLYLSVVLYSINIAIQCDDISISIQCDDISISIQCDDISISVQCDDINIVKFHCFI